VFTRAIDLLDRTGGLQPRVPQPSPALIEARDAVSRLIARWDDGLADRITADNLFLDRSKERRRREIDQLRAAVGECGTGGPFSHVENALRGTWPLACERGTLHVSVTLAPTMPPRVQFLEVGRTPPRPRQRCEG
jgi:hypothetical protein